MTWKYIIKDRRMGPAIARELDQEMIEDIMEEGPTYEARKKSKKWWETSYRSDPYVYEMRPIILSSQQYQALQQELLKYGKK